IITAVASRLSFHGFLVIPLNKFNNKYITVAIINIRLFILIIYASIVKSEANTGYCHFFVSVYLIIKYTERRHSARLGISPYINVESIGNDINVSIKINSNILFILYFLDNCTPILYIENTIKIFAKIFNTLN